MIDVHDPEWSNGGADYTSNGASDVRHTTLSQKGAHVFVFLALLALIAVASIVMALVDVAHDGHSRTPERALVRIF